MDIVRPQSAPEMARVLRECAAAGQSIHLGGAFTKRLMAGPLGQADVTVSTSNLNGVLEYEPRDLTISVGAGMRFAELTRILAENGQMVPLDPPFFDDATVGGVVAANTSGPRRRLYGSARDLIIGMTFATLEGKLINSGGMVVKNVAGLDMGKLMIGSFGTLAAMTSVNFKLQPAPVAEGTFVTRFADATTTFGARDRILDSVLQPSAVDILNPQAAGRVGLDQWCLLVRVGGNARVMERYAREFSAAEALEPEQAVAIWARIREYTRDFLQENANGAVARISTTIVELKSAVEAFDVPVVARAANGICYAYFVDCAAANLHGHKGVIEYAPESGKASMDLWPSPGNDFAMMEKVKKMFDPGNLLNRGRMYGRL
ncbi:MAG TPA: FAD-binding oxidoreductase [Bryobacteraceae bacterium]|nr:FAD-binding oxidoreductase [Bryobacteraceae bacterium]